MDWNGAASWLGLLVSIVGFALALWQIKRTRSAIEAARLAFVSAERRLAQNQLFQANLRKTRTRPPSAATEAFRRHASVTVDLAGQHLGRSKAYTGGNNDS